MAENRGEGVEINNDMNNEIDNDMNIIINDNCLLLLDIILLLLDIMLRYWPEMETRFFKYDLYSI